MIRKLSQYEEFFRVMVGVSVVVYLDKGRSMNRWLIFSLLLVMASNSYACGDTYTYRAMDVAGYITFGLFLLTVIVLPFSILLIARLTRLPQLLLLFASVVTGLFASIALMIIDSHPYMIPGSIVLAAFSLFSPYVYLFVKSILLYRMKG